MHEEQVTSCLSRFRTVSLENLCCIGLMNRVEVKYIFRAARLPHLISMLADHYDVLEINGRKALPYSTTYLDTDDYLFYYQHLRGKLNRYKIRYRKYEATNESFLEIKKKTNTGRTIKWRVENDFAHGGFDLCATDFISEHLPVSCSAIKANQFNKFSRITFASFRHKERLTIDFNISFAPPGGRSEISLPYIAVAELKKEAASHYSPFKNLIRPLQIYPSGFSKYCIGSALLNDSLRKNAIKPTFLLINKFENEHTRLASHV
jgi:hypothetical protein